MKNRSGAALFPMDLVLNTKRSEPNDNLPPGWLLNLNRFPFHYSYLKQKIKPKNEKREGRFRFRLDWIFQLLIRKELRTIYAESSIRWSDLFYSTISEQAGYFFKSKSNRFCFLASTDAFSSVWSVLLYCLGTSGTVFS